jgi:non-ribosomal peptide synthetase component F
MLPLRIRANEAETFAGLLDKTRRAALSAFKNQNYPFDQLSGKLGIKRDKSRNPIFDVEVDLHNFTNLSVETTEGFDGLKVFQLPQSARDGGKFDLDFIFSDTENMSLILHFNRDLYERGDIKMLMENLYFILERISREPHTHLRDLYRLIESNDDDRRQAESNRFKQSRIDKLKQLKYAQ